MGPNVHHEGMAVGHVSAPGVLLGKGENNLVIRVGVEVCLSRDSGGLIYNTERDELPQQY